MKKTKKNFYFSTLFLLSFSIAFSLVGCVSNSQSRGLAIKDSTGTKPIATNRVTPATQKQETRTLQGTLDNLIESKKIDKMSLSYTKTSYSSGEAIEFALDTVDTKGYLTIFYVNSNDITLLYPNSFIEPKELKGRYIFPRDLSNGKFQLEAYKNCHSCQEEKTVIYTLLSTRPILDVSAIRSKDGLISFSKGSSRSSAMSRAIKVKTTTKVGFRPQLGKYEFIVR